MKSSTKVRNGHGSLYKEVRFSPTATPIRRTQSVPNAYAVAHATQLLSQATTTKGADSATLSASYLQQAQSLLNRQRMMVDTERALFAEERELWVQERQILLTRIAELESLLKRSAHGQTDNTPLTSASTSASQTGASTQKRSISFQIPFKPPHYSSNPDQPSQNSSSNNAQVWEGSSPGSRPTRVFPDAENPDLLQHHPSSTDQGGDAGTGTGLSVSALSLDRALSPKSHAADSATNLNMSVPIEKLDSKLDGITLKSSALHPEIVARVMTPPSPASRETSPCSSSHRSVSDRRCSLKLKLTDLGPPEKNLVKDAGHTPMVFIDRDEADTQTHSLKESEGPSPSHSPSQNPSNESSPLAPGALRQPAESSDTYFADLPDDPALKGPLSLTNEEEHDSNFLRELDQKLLGEARQILGPPAGVKSEAAEESSQEAQGEGQEQEQDPEIKFKKTTNFGTAFGTELR